MEKKNQIPKYPLLRFPEFTDEWKEVTLGEVAAFFSGGTPSTYNKTFYKGDIPFIRSGEIHDSRTELAISKEAVEGSSAKIVFVGDILLALYGATSGDIAISKMRGAINQAILCIRPSSEIDRDFLFFIWEYRKEDIVRKYIQGGQGNLSAEIVKNIPLRLPALPEQRKIAALLSLIDERIEVQNAIIKEQEVAKTSLIRRLFDRTLRFPEFTDEWKVVKLGEVGEKQHAKNADDSIDRVYTNSAQDGIVEQTEFFDKEIANGNNLSGYYIVKQYDFVYNPRLSKTAPVGAMNLNKNTGIGLVSPLYTVFRITARSVLNEFLEYLFESTSWHGYMNEVANFGARSDRMNIKDKDFFNLPLRLPSLLEQRKIADLLSAVDERIAVEKEYATLLQKQKAYLLRQMFV